MNSWLMILNLGLGLTFVRSMLIAAKVIPPTCARCGHLRERRELGDRVCSCALDGQ
jgi:hypothetical protein